MNGYEREPRFLPLSIRPHVKRMVHTSNRETFLLDETIDFLSCFALLLHYLVILSIYVDTDCIFRCLNSVTIFNSISLNRTRIINTVATVRIVPNGNDQSRIIRKKRACDGETGGDTTYSCKIEDMCSIRAFLDIKET